MNEYPYVENPEAIGDPNQMPRVWIPPGPAGDFLRWAALNNARLIAAETCNVCQHGTRGVDGAYNCPAEDCDCTATWHGHGGAVAS